MRVGVMKPVDPIASEDGRALALAVGSIMRLELIGPYRATGAEPDLANIARCFDEIAAQSDVVLVESAGTIDCSVTKDADFADLAAMLELEVIVVVGNRRGWAEALALALRRCESCGLAVAGYILCDCDRAAEASDESLTGISPATCLGRLRHREPLARSIVEKLI